jgi:hypothetical protein
MLRRATLLLLLSCAASSAQAPYPTPPRPLGEAEEIALAVTAAPSEISGKADVYVLRGTDFVKAKAGTNGCACMVGRDSHDGSRYPICFDQEGAKTTLFREMMESSLRAKGKTEAEVKRTVDAAFAKGTLRMPSKTSVAYMMSPKQVLFSSAEADGKRVGAWSPHIMVMLPGVVPDQLGLAPQSSVDIIQISTKGDHHSELVVKVPKWSDGTPVKP